MVAILRGNVQQGGFVADMVITGGIAGNVLTSPINANALPATFDGSSIFALNASNVSTGVLSVLRGGTGTTTSTGSGNVVLSNNPTVTGGLALTSGISILPDDPGTFIEKRYGIGNATNRYGLGQYPFGIFRFYNANVYSGTWNFCRSTGENTFTDVAIVDSAGGFTIIGNGYKPGGGSWAASSDIRIKENVQNANVDLCYDSVKNLPLKRFEYTREYLDKNPSVEDTHVVGWVADDVMGVFPKSVKEIDAFGYSNLKTLDVDQLYKTMWGALTKVIRDKEALEARLAAAGL